MYEVILVEEFEEWLNSLENEIYISIAAGIDQLANHGYTLGRPFVDHINGSYLHNLKELRPRGSAKNYRILFVFDPQRQAVLLIGGDKTGNWDKWYKKAIKQAEKRYQKYLKGQKNE